MPAIAIPLAALVSSSIDTLLAGLVLVGFYFAGGGTIGWAALWLVPIAGGLAQGG